jgi:hypothetical protein
MEPIGRTTSHGDAGRHRLAAEWMIGQGKKAGVPFGIIPVAVPGIAE